ncbi:MAG TPA: hypothetical protein VFI56_03135 [Vicinamibacterales bacterium]|nr:hypothetical protein [Vicinamibacterales bacterium]
MTHHFTEDELTLYYYGEGRGRHDIERHLESCADCSATYREIAGTLAMVAAPEVPERGDQYGLEVWQRIRHKLPDRETGFARFARFSGFSRFTGFPGFSGFREFSRFGPVAAAALLVIAAFVGGRLWQRSITPVDNVASNASRSGNPANPEHLANPANPANPTNRENPEHRSNPANLILLTSVADHLEQSERVLSDIMNAPRGDISAEQRWADDLVDASRLYRQDAIDAGEMSVAAILDDLERSLIEIVNSPSKISAADLDQIRRRIDAASLLFKVRVMSDELRQREQAPDRPAPRTSTSTRVTS